MWSMSDIPVSGWWDGKAHLYPFRVYYADTDAGRVVYHARYLDFAERARTEMMRLIDGNQTYRGNGEGLAFLVRAAEIDYRAPARLDDVLAVRSRAVKLGGASFCLEQEVRRDDIVLAIVLITLVCVSEIGHPTRIPDALREKLAGLIG
jgi:acyl-CoA thioester hydrolase